MAKEIEKYLEPKFCRTISSDKVYSGTFRIHDQTIKTELFDFNDEVYIKNDDTIVIWIEGNSYISLLNNYILEGQTPFGTEEGSVAKNCIIKSRTAVVGLEKWKLSDKVGAVEFEISGLQNLFLNKEVQKILTSDFRKHCRSVLEISFEEFSLTVTPLATYSGLSIIPTVVKIVFKIKFVHGQSIKDYIKFVTAITRFFSFSCGRDLRPREISIWKFGIDDTLRSVNDANTWVDQKCFVFYSTQVDKNDDFEDPIYHSIWNCWDKKERTFTESALKEWIKRMPDWNSAYSLMKASLRDGNVLSSNRFLDSSKWFENIPSAKAVGKNTSVNLEKVIDAACAAALGDNIKLDRRRVAGLFSNLKMESDADQTRRLLERLAVVFGHDLIDLEKLTKELESKIRWRGQSAHGTVEFSDDEEFKPFADASVALEFVCLLLTIEKLPLSEFGRARLKNHPIAFSYRGPF
jgi:hypothetical protein